MENSVWSKAAIAILMAVFGSPALADPPVCVAKPTGPLCVTVGQPLIVKRSITDYENCTVSSATADGTIRYTCGSETLTASLNDLSIVTALSSVGGIAAGSELIVRDAAKTYDTYRVSALFSDGMAELYSRAAAKTSFRAIEELVRDRVTTSPSLLLTVPTCSGSESVTIVAGSDVTIREAPGDYEPRSVSTIYSDGSVSLFDRAAAKATVLSQAELADAWVAPLAAIGALTEGETVGLLQPATVDPLARVDARIVSLYTDGVVSLYLPDSAQSSFPRADAIASQTIATLSSLDQFAAGDIDQVTDVKGASLLVAPITLYADRVLRYVPLTTADAAPDDRASARLAREADLRFVKRLCASDCVAWWRQNGADALQRR